MENPNSKCQPKTLKQKTLQNKLGLNLSELLKWNENVVFQKDAKYGCIPWGFEWMIRYNGIENLKKTFQIDVSLGKSNSFDRVAFEVKKRYPQIIIQHKDFHDGNRTVEFVREQIEKDIPCLIVYPKKSADGELVGHAAPVVRIDSKNIKVISATVGKENQTQEFPITYFLSWYTNCGCSDIAWLNKC